MNRKKLVIIILMSFAVLNGGKWLTGFVSSPYLPIDFRTYSFSAKGAFKHENPYSFATQNKYRTVQQMQHGIRFYDAESPHQRTVYAPQFIWFFALFSAFNHEVAVWIYFVLQVLAILVIIRLTAILGQQDSAFMISAFLAFRGTWYMLDTGQPMPFVLAACLCAVMLLEKNKGNLIPGLLIGAAAFKFTMIIPFAVWLLVRKEYFTLILAAVVSITLNVSAILMFDADGTWLRAWFENMNQMWGYPHMYNQINGLSVISTSISVPAAYFIDLNKDGLRLAMSVTYLCALILLTVFSNNVRSSKKYFLLFLIQLTGLSLGQHLIYDIFALICFFMISEASAEKIKWPGVALLILLILPVGKIAEWSGLEALHFALPVLLFINWAIYTGRYFPRKYSPVKKAS